MPSAIKQSASQGAGVAFEGDLKKNGWTKLPNGLILQWGTTNSFHQYSGAGSNGWTDVNYETLYFPIPFPHECITVSFTLRNPQFNKATAAQYDAGGQIHELYKDHVNIVSQNYYTDTMWIDFYYDFIAIGY